MPNDDLKAFLARLHNNQNILKEREAKYGATAPLDLLNQIDDYGAAISEVEAALSASAPPDVTELEERFERLILGINVVLVASDPERPIFTGSDDQPPYRGLQKFTEDDHAYFFGRTAAVAALLEEVRYLVETPTSAEEPDLLAVLGASGSGKSSLVRAGLIPALRDGQAIPGSRHWSIAVMQPGPRPLEALAHKLVPYLHGRGLPSIQDDLGRGPAVLHQLMLEALADQPDEAVFVLVVDQFEELFTQTESEDERQAYLDMLLHAAQLSGNRSFIILTMRADFYDQASQYKALAGMITQHQLLVAPMDERELREAILRPAEAVGLELDKGLEERLIADTLDQPGGLPLLQHALLELYNRREETGTAHKRHARLLLTTYRQIGGVQGALAKRADTVLDSLPPEQQTLAQNIFLRLTTLGEGVSDTRRRVARSELYPAGIAAEMVDGVLQALSGKQARLIVAEQETVEVTHEALIQQWGQLQAWLEANRDSLRIHRRVTEAAREWAAKGHDNSYLFRGVRLAEVEAWLAEHGDALTPEEWAFVNAGLAERERVAKEAEERRQKDLAQAQALAKEQQHRAEEQTQAAVGLRRRALIAAVVGLVAVMAAIVAGIFFFRAQDSAQAALAAEGTAVANEQLAQERAAQAQSSQATAEAEAERAEDNQAEAERQSEVALKAQAQAEIEAALARSRQLAAQAINAVNDQNPELALLLGLEAISTTQTMEGLDAIYVARANNHTRRAFYGHTATVNQASWSQDESQVLTRSADYTVRIWDAQTGAELARMDGHTAWIIQASWSQDESQVLTASDDNTARIWDAQTGAELARMDDHTAWIIQATWSQDESQVLTASADYTVRIWDVDRRSVKEHICQQTARNMTWDEWRRYMEEPYRPTCPNAPIPPDAIEGILENELKPLASQSQFEEAAAQLAELVGWLAENHQYNTFGRSLEGELETLRAGENPWGE